LRPLLSATALVRYESECRAVAEAKTVDEGRNFTTRHMRAPTGAQFPARTGTLRQFKADHPQRHLCPEACMTDKKFLTPEEVSERYRGEVTVGTLRNWRAMRIGPAFVKIGKAVLYPIDELDAWDQKNLVTCRAARRPVGTRSDQA
jgi:hypothetical protein